MSSTALVIAILVVVIVVAAIAFVAMQANRRRQLQDRFGPEYQRTVAETGDTRKAERVLDDRMKRRKELDIRDLDPSARTRYAESWRVIQTRFVDDPRGAVREADVLVTTVMRDRGYPTDGFEQQAEYVSVDHAGVVDNYRNAHRVSEADAGGNASTDDLRQAMVHYRALFNDLLGQPASGSGPRTEVK
jgi:FtsZ-interacting cell division protein ZipA